MHDCHRCEKVKPTVLEKRRVKISVDVELTIRDIPAAKQVCGFVPAGMEDSDVQANLLLESDILQSALNAESYMNAVLSDMMFTLAGNLCSSVSLDAQYKKKKGLSDFLHRLSPKHRKFLKQCLKTKEGREALDCTLDAAVEMSIKGPFIVEQLESLERTQLRSTDL
jgi:hypothetical protein